MIQELNYMDSQFFTFGLGLLKRAGFQQEVAELMTAERLADRLECHARETERVDQHSAADYRARARAIRALVRREAA